MRARLSALPRVATRAESSARGTKAGPDPLLLAFSPQGHILVLAGFGNLQGHMEVWDMKKHKQV